MTRRALHSLLFSSLMATAGAEVSTEIAAPGAFNWLSGCWQSAAVGSGAAPGYFNEMWTSSVGGNQFGVGRFIIDGRLQSFEYTRIEHRDDGVFFRAHPNGGPETAFKLIEHGPGRAVFSNPAHDFPQRVLYWREGVQLHARVDGLVDGKQQIQGFVYHPVHCQAD